MHQWEQSKLSQDNNTNPLKDWFAQFAEVSSHGDKEKLIGRQRNVRD